MSSWADNSDDGWDLFAVVRSCRSASRPSQPNPMPKQANTAPANGAAETPMFPSYFPSLTARGISNFDIENICSSPFSSAAPQSKLTPWTRSSSSAVAAAASAGPRRPLSQSASRSKRRRNQLKRVVCQVPADGLAADMWAWRKYGQKPIKGSPYPRGYYRCSSSKGCLARKQVERSRTDAGKFVITYTGEHSHPVPTHRNSLAGSTRQKFSAAAAGDQTNQARESSSNTTLKREECSGEEEAEEDEEEGDEDEEEEGVLLVEDMEVVGEDEVLFMGVEKFQDSSAGSSSMTPDQSAAACSSAQVAAMRTASSSSVHGRKVVAAAADNIYEFEACLENWTF